MKRVFVDLLRAYHRYLSPSLAPACRFTPTCSVYAAEAVEKHGLRRGLILGLWRLVRCHPYSRGGFDPVP